MTTKGMKAFAIYFVAGIVWSLTAFLLGALLGFAEGFVLGLFGVSEIAIAYGAVAMTLVAQPIFMGVVIFKEKNGKGIVGWLEDKFF